ncbi:MAG: sugar phosphate isomerase/epimerase family protein [Planctomycetota bacterium]
MATTEDRLEPFGYCLNTSTIREQEIGLREEFELAAELGYDGIEPWVSEMDAYVEEGGSLAELGRKADELGLSVENAIGFFDWVVEDEARRREGLEQARRCMAMARQVGCKRLAAPPSGATEATDVRPEAAAERYAELLEIGEEYGVVPMVEFWGVSATLGRLGEAVHVALQSGHRDACVLADVFHMYKGGSPYAGLRLVGPRTLGLFHVNDFPESPPREQITDADRVFPGEGVAPLGRILRDLYAAGWRGMLSLELFNEEYWKMDAEEVLRAGLASMRSAVRQALSEI